MCFFFGYFSYFLIYDTVNGNFYKITIETKHKNSKENEKSQQENNKTLNNQT